MPSEKKKKGRKEKKDGKWAEIYSLTGCLSAGGTGKLLEKSDEVYQG
jgi:hypothetical protein